MIFMIKVMEIKADAERKKCGLFPGAGRVKSPSRRCSQPAEANPVPGDVQPEPYDSFLYLNLTGPALPVRFL